MRVIKWLFLLLLAAAIACTGGLYWYVLKRPIPIQGAQDSVIIKVEKGSNARSIANSLAAAGLEVNPTAVFQAFKYFGYDRSIHVGRYLIHKDMTLKDVVEHIASGDVMMSSFLMVEGTESSKFLKNILASEDLEHSDDNLTAEALMNAVGAPEGTHPEGQFAPATYTVPTGSEDMTVFRQAYKEQAARVKRAWDKRSALCAAKSPYELLILASIIEKETGRPEDRPLVSSVFNNRLKRGMLLQTDPTVVYGIENFDGKITKKHLKTDHPYNTYTRSGLPPTPICNPGEAALTAAAQPAETDYLYFSAMGRSGQTKFSKSLKEHNAAVQKYLRSQGL